MNAPSANPRESQQNCERMQVFQDARATLEEAQRCYFEAFRKAFPVGSVITSTKRTSGIRCEILRHGYRDDVLVRSRTGRDYWLDAYWIEEAGIRK